MEGGREVKIVTDAVKSLENMVHLLPFVVLIINVTSGSPAQPAGHRPVVPHGIDFFCVKTILLLLFVEVWGTTVTAGTRTPLRGLGATSLVQTGRSRGSSALLTHAQVGTSSKRNFCASGK